MVELVNFTVGIDGKRRPSLFKEAKVLSQKGDRVVLEVRTALGVERRNFPVSKLRKKETA